MIFKKSRKEKCGKIVFFSSSHMSPTIQSPKMKLIITITIIITTATSNIFNNTSRKLTLSIPNHENNPANNFKKSSYSFQIPL